MVARVDAQLPNPYETPALLADGGRGRWEFARHSGCDSQLLGQGVLYRCVQLEAPIRTTLVFWGRSVWRDVVLLDGRLAASAISWWRITPQFEIPLLIDQQPAVLRVQLNVGSFLRLLGFRVAIGDETVYQEGVLASTRLNRS